MQDDIRDTFASLAQTIDGLSSHVEAVSKQGLIGGQPTARELGEAIQRTRDLLRHPLLPSSWLESDPAELVRSIESLHAAEQTLEQLNKELFQFSSTNCGITESARNAISGARDEQVGRLMSVGVQNQPATGA